MNKCCSDFDFFPTKFVSVKKSFSKLLVELEEKQKKLLEETVAEFSNSSPLADTTPSEDDLSFSHPYYWSAFTLVGSPW